MHNVLGSVPHRQNLDRKKSGPIIPGISLLHLQQYHKLTTNPDGWLRQSSISQTGETFLMHYSSHRVLRGFFYFSSSLLCVVNMESYIYRPEWHRSIRILQVKTGCFPTHSEVQTNNLINARKFGIKMEDDCGNEKTLK